MLRFVLLSGSGSGGSGGSASGSISTRRPHAPVDVRSVVALPARRCSLTTRRAATRRRRASHAAVGGRRVAAARCIRLLLRLGNLGCPRALLLNLCHPQPLLLCQLPHAPRCLLVRVRWQDRRPRKEGLVATHDTRGLIVESEGRAVVPLILDVGPNVDRQRLASSSRTPAPSSALATAGLLAFITLLCRTRVQPLHASHRAQVPYPHRPLGVQRHGLHEGVVEHNLSHRRAVAVEPCNGRRICERPEEHRVVHPPGEQLPRPLAHAKARDASRVPTEGPRDALFLQVEALERAVHRGREQRAGVDRRRKAERGHPVAVHTVLPAEARAVTASRRRAASIVQRSALLQVLEVEHLNRTALVANRQRTRAHHVTPRKDRGGRLVDRVPSVPLDLVLAVLRDVITIVEMDDTRAKADGDARVVDPLAGARARPHLARNGGWQQARAEGHRRPPPRHLLKRPSRPERAAVPEGHAAIGGAREEVAPAVLLGTRPDFLWQPQQSRHRRRVAERRQRRRA